MGRGAGAASCECFCVAACCGVLQAGVAVAQSVLQYVAACVAAPNTRLDYGKCCQETMM